MAATTTFSLFFPLPNKQVNQWPDEEDDHISITTSATGGRSVDCTLSLGTPSSSVVEPMTTKHVVVTAPDHQSPYYYCRPPANKCAAAAHDAFADWRCANCGTSSTPLWRNGPRGPKSLCNACGIRFKKEERRAAAMESAVGCRYEYAAAVAKAFPCCGGGDVDANAPFLAWRLNVVAPAPSFAAVWPERTNLFPYN